MNIAEMSRTDKALIALILFLAAALVLGASALLARGAGELSTKSAPLPPGGQVVASRNGSKYFLPWCSTAARISEVNKIWFPSAKTAEQAGYGPAGNCKGL